MKTCTKCKKELPLEKFSFRNKKKDIRQSNCKSCQKIMKDAHYRSNKQYYLDRGKESKERYKQWWKELKGTLKCVKCGESHIATLDFHHTDKDIKFNNVGFMVGNQFSKEIVLEEIKKCIVLCANCHRKLHYEEDNVPLV